MVEGARLEIVWARKRLEGSNPFASARISYYMVTDSYILYYESFLSIHYRLLVHCEKNGIVLWLSESEGFAAWWRGVD